MFDIINISLSAKLQKMSFVEENNHCNHISLSNVQPGIREMKSLVLPQVFLSAFL